MTFLVCLVVSLILTLLVWCVAFVVYLRVGSRRVSASGFWRWLGRIVDTDYQTPAAKRTRNLILVILLAVIFNLLSELFDVGWYVFPR